MGVNEFDLFIGGLNILILLVMAWIKVDVASLKVYMHEKFVTREEWHDGK